MIPKRNRNTAVDKDIKNLIRLALREDHTHKDITTNCLVRRDQISSASIIAKENAVVCGVDLVTVVFRELDPRLSIQAHCRDGEEVAPDEKIISLDGKTRALLTGERTALNFISYLSGIATLTRLFVKEVAGFPVKIMDTRKTLPGMRSLAKMAVRCGGGVNHRFNLKEMVMIKDNHLLAYESDATVQKAIRHLRRRTRRVLVVEVDTLQQFQEAIDAQPDIIMLDNMSIPEIEQAVALRNAFPKKCLLEASGGITLANVRRIAQTGVDRISIGSLTHSSRAIDFSMEFNVCAGNRKKP